MSDEPRFEGRVALVTGASRGIGRAIALSFAAEGASVAMMSTNRERNTAVADEIATAGGRALPVTGDVTREEDVRRVISEVEGKLGPIDILVNNAGIAGPTAPVSQMPAADWERVLAVNLTGPFLCSREVLKGMMARAGAVPDKTQVRSLILNIGSIAGRISYPQRAPYASAKWGLIGFTMTLAEEVGPYGIRVNCICPGPVEGEMIDRVIAARARAMGLPEPAVRQKFMSLTMLKRMVRAGDVAATALFLASDAAMNITGQAIDVSGGIAQLPG